MFKQPHYKRHTHSGVWLLLFLLAWVGSIANVGAPGTLKWTYPTAGLVTFSSPVLGADGTVYVGSTEGQLYALNPNGTLKWAYPTGSYIDSSPAVGADGTVYVGSYNHQLYALNPDMSSALIFMRGYL